jgi:predicted metal-dependent hydrolase
MAGRSCGGGDQDLRVAQDVGEPPRDRHQVALAAQYEHRTAVQGERIARSPPSAERVRPDRRHLQAVIAEREERARREQERAERPKKR